ncbi:hypothetical protein FACS189434_11010 [Bacteroidia bacterium]|nr:hypothetical protein FACS189434_11010 [Bacteroidia bacterium]
MEKEKIRELFHTDEFDDFYNSLDNKVASKYDNVILYLETVYVLSTKFVKKVVDTNLYEARVSVGFNEYRSLIFAADHENVIQAKKIILLNSFLKKSTKDYDKQIKQAINILNNLENDTTES